MGGVIAERIVYPQPHGTTFDHYPPEEENRTRQSDAQAADINLTIKKYNLQPLELEPGWSGRIGAFMDITEVPTYQEAWNQIVKAEEVFMELPPEVRERFNNSYVQMLDAWQQGQQAEVFEQIGWLQRKPANRPAEKPVEPAVEEIAP